MLPFVISLVLLSEYMLAFLFWRGSNMVSSLFVATLSQLDAVTMRSWRRLSSRQALVLSGACMPIAEPPARGNGWDVGRLRGCLLPAWSLSPERPSLGDLRLLIRRLRLSPDEERLPTSPLGSVWLLLIPTPSVRLIVMLWLSHLSGGRGVSWG